MGCSAAKNLTVEHLDGSKVTELTPQNGDSEPRKVSIPRGVSDIPVIESTEPKTEVLGDETLNNMHETGRINYETDLKFYSRQIIL